MCKHPEAHWLIKKLWTWIVSPRSQEQRREIGTEP